MRSDLPRLFIREFCKRLTSTRRTPCYAMCTVPKLTPTTKEAFLRLDEDKGKLNFSFQYTDSELKINRQLNFSRNVNETVDDFLRKINFRILTETHKKISKRKRVKMDMLTSQKLIAENTNVEENKIALYNGNTQISKECTLESIVEGDTDLKLVIFDNIYLIKVNLPTITDVELNPVIMVGFPTYPCTFKGEYVDQTVMQFVWYRHEIDNMCAEWKEVGTGYTYLPQPLDVGCKLKFLCIPRNKRLTGSSFTTISPNPVITGPPSFPFEDRHKFTTTKLQGNKITSYNILAGVYTDSDYSRDILFNYCPQHALSMDYRKQLILKELIGYNSDIICLQEVDKSVFETDLLPMLSTHGYNGRYITKNKQKEGLATFFDKARFYVAASDTAVMGDNVNLGNFGNVWAQITNEKTKDRFLKRSTTVQINALISKETPDVMLLVANTHLYYHPDADHIRLLQGYYVIEYLTYFTKKLKAECPFNRINVILCGDFNTTPDSGLYSLITTGSAPETLPDWKSNAEESVENICLTHDFKLNSACGTPQYTNYTPNFAGCLDYIFYDTRSFKVTKMIEMPSVEQMSKYQGLPSVLFPSDHVALCVEMMWET